MKKLISALLVLLLAFSLTACQSSGTQGAATSSTPVSEPTSSVAEVSSGTAESKVESAPESKVESETVVIPETVETLAVPVEGLEWGMTIDEAKAALPADCTFEGGDAVVSRMIYVQVRGYSGTIYGCPIDEDNKGMLQLGFRVPLNYEGGDTTPRLETIRTFVACEDYEAICTAISATMGKPFAQVEGGNGNYGDGTINAAMTTGWRPTGPGIQAYSAEVECLAAAMYGFYYGGNIPDGFNLTNIKTLDEYGEMNLDAVDVVRRLPAYDGSQAGELIAYDYTSPLYKCVVIDARAGLPVLAGVAEAELNK